MIDTKPAVQEFCNFRQRNITIRALIDLRMQRDHDRFTGQRPGVHMVYALDLRQRCQLALDRVSIETCGRSLQQDVRRVRGQLPT